MAWTWLDALCQSKSYQVGVSALTLQKIAMSRLSVFRVESRIDHPLNFLFALLRGQ